MKNFIKTLALLTIITGSLCQVNAQSCNYSGDGGCTSNLQNPSSRAWQVMDDVCRSLNIQRIYIYQGQLANACATTLSNGTPIISYNPAFLNFLESKNFWAPVSVIAHEVGHHYYAHSSWYGQFEHSWSKELKADYVSGYAMFKMGASLYDAQSAFRVMFSWLGSESHPDTPSRMDALTAGYNRASLGY
jgi:hypothetical protein